MASTQNSDPLWPRIAKILEALEILTTHLAQTQLKLDRYQKTTKDVSNRKKNLVEEKEDVMNQSILSIVMRMSMM